MSQPSRLTPSAAARGRTSAGTPSTTGCASRRALSCCALRKMRSSSPSGRTTLSARSRIAVMLASTMSNACHSFGVSAALRLSSEHAVRAEMHHEHEPTTSSPRSIAASRMSISSARKPLSSTARPASCAIAAIPSTTWRSTRPSRRRPTCCSTASCRRQGRAGPHRRRPEGRPPAAAADPRHHRGGQGGPSHGRAAHGRLGAGRVRSGGRRQFARGHACARASGSPRRCR